MQENAILVVVEILSVSDPAGMKEYQERAGKLIGPRGGVCVGSRDWPRYGLKVAEQ